LAELATKGLDSNHSRLAYQRAIGDFIEWYEAAGRPALRLFVLESYREHLKESGKGAANINQRLSAIRRMIRKAAANGFMPEAEARSAASVEGVGAPGRSVGRWLSKGQAEALLTALPRQTLAQKRDLALIAIALSSGLRRAEIAALQVVTPSGSRWAARDTGDRWQAEQEAGYSDIGLGPGGRSGLDRRGRDRRRNHLPPRQQRGPGCRSKHDTRSNPAVSREGYRMAANQAGANIPQLACHDLRRSFAQLARKGGAPIEQIAKSLGHASIVTTQVYLGIDQDFSNAPADCLGLDV
jgi:integrase